MTKRPLPLEPPVVGRTPSLAAPSTLLAMFVYSRRLARTGNPLEQLWAEYYWRTAKLILAGNGLKPTWKGRRWALTPTP